MIFGRVFGGTIGILPTPLGGGGYTGDDVMLGYGDAMFG